MLIPVAIDDITTNELDSAYQDADFSADIAGVDSEYFQILALGTFKLGESVIIKEGESNLKGSVRLLTQFVDGDADTIGAIIWLRRKDYINWKKVNT